jgi:hypothetical protein
MIDSAFSKACREYNAQKHRYEGNAGCFIPLATGLMASVLAGIWSGSILLGLVLCLSLPLGFTIAYTAFINRFFLRPYEDRVTRIVENYIGSLLQSSNSAHRLKLSGVGLPHGNFWEIQFDLSNGRYSVVERMPLDKAVRHSDSLESVAIVVNAQATEAQLDELKQMAGGIEAAGELSFESRVKDGLPFTLEIHRDGRKRVCTGNFSGLPPRAAETPELKVAEVLYELCSVDQSGSASCSPDGKITLLSKPPTTDPVQHIIEMLEKDRAVKAYGDFEVPQPLERIQPLGSFKFYIVDGASFQFDFVALPNGSYAIFAANNERAVRLTKAGKEIEGLLAERWPDLAACDPKSLCDLVLMFFNKEGQHHRVLSGIDELQSFENLKMFGGQGYVIDQKELSRVAPLIGKTESRIENDHLLLRGVTLITGMCGEQNFGIETFRISPQGRVDPAQRAVLSKSIFKSLPWYIV